MRAETRLIAAIVAGAQFMQMLDSAIINTSLPQMAASFHATALDLSVGITVYLITAAAFVPLSGWLADRYGSRTVFMSAVALFTLSSLGCGVAPNLLAFCMARAAQGAGGAMMIPVGRIIVLRSAHNTELLQVTALLTWPALTAPVIAPALGGFITTYISWRWNFLLNVPLGVLGVALILRFVPNLKVEGHRGLDWPGFAMSSGALMALLYGLELLSHAPIPWSESVAFILAGSVLGVLALRHFGRVPAPLLQLAAVKVPTFEICSVTAGPFVRAAISATPFLLPLLFQLVFGLSALASGSLVLAYFFGNMAIKPLTTPVLRWFGFRPVLLVNGMLVGAAIAACALLVPRTPHWAIVSVLLLAGSTRSMQYTCLNTLTYADINASQRSSAATLSSVIEQLATVLGVGFGAFALNAAQLWRGSAVVDLTDFRIAFLIAGALAFAASLRFLKLPVDAGAEVTGHQRSAVR